MRVGNYLNCERTERNPGAFQRALITADDGAVSFRMFVWEIEPGISRNPHSHPGEHAALVLSGKGLFRSGNRETQIEKDSVIFIASNEEHTFLNTGDEPLCYLLVHTNYGEESRRG